MPKQPSNQTTKQTPNQTTTEGTSPVPTATDTKDQTPNPTAADTKDSGTTSGSDAAKDSGTTAAPATPKVSTDDLVAAYTKAFGAFVTSDAAIDADSMPTALVDAFRALPPATRGKGSASAMKAAMRSGADVDRIADADEAVGRAASKQTAKPAVAADPNQAGADRIAAALLTLLAVGSALPQGADPAMSLSTALGIIDPSGKGHADIITGLSALGGLPSVPTPSADQGRVLGAAGRAVAALTRQGKGGSGQRQTIDRSLANVADGPLTLTHQGTTHKAALKDGAIIIGKNSFDNPTAAAKSVLPADTSVNGWVVWKRDGTTLADLHPQG